mmetsp:Transcript_7900/g.17055  ORF Transcript_7900/g.17055 Transcript_7900/m.17055 type:complete len:131 (-) Transcript_7900:877-1269(-)
MASIILRQNSSQHCQGARQQRVESCNGEYCGERQRTSRAVNQRHSVDPHENCGDWHRKKSSSDKNTANPSFSIHLQIKPRGYVAANGTGQTVEYNHSGKDGSPTGCRNEVSQRQAKKEKSCHNELDSGSN